jgi:hypothetical protein
MAPHASFLRNAAQTLEHRTRKPRHRRSRLELVPDALAVRAEVRRLAADEADRDEMRLIREQLAELAPPATD